MKIKIKTFYKITEKIFSLIFLSLLFYFLSFGLIGNLLAVTAFPPTHNQTAQVIAGVDESNIIRILKLNSDGTLSSTSSTSSTTTVTEASQDPINSVTTISSAGATDHTQLPNNNVHSCTLQASSTNLGNIYIGGNTITNSIGSNEGIHFSPGDSFSSVALTNSNQIFVAADNVGDQVKLFCN